MIDKCIGYCIGFCIGMKNIIYALTSLLVLLLELCWVVIKSLGLRILCVLSSIPYKEK